MKRSFYTLFTTGLVVLSLASCAKKDETTVTDSSSTSMSAPNTSASGSDTSNRSSTPNTTANTTSIQWTDENIVAALDEANTMEIDAGKMAQSKAKSADVKSFAKMMVDDHTKMKNEGQQLSKKASITPAPAQGDTLRQQADNTKAMLQPLSGRSFDSTYIASQVMGHQQVESMLRDMEGRAQNADLKSMITAAIPKVHAHLEKAQQIQSKLNSSSTAGADSTSTKKKG